MSLTAYIRYDNKGRIVPGGPIVTSVKPKVGDWVAISDVLVTTTPPNYKLRAFVRYINKIGGQNNSNKYVAGSLILQHDAPQDGNWKEVYFIKPCESCNTTTTTTSTSTSTTSTTTTATPTTTTTTTAGVSSFDIHLLNLNFVNQDASTISYVRDNITVYAAPGVQFGTPGAQYFFDPQLIAPLSESFNANIAIRRVGYSETYRYTAQVSSFLGNYAENLSKSFYVFSQTTYIDLLVYKMLNFPSRPFPIANGGVQLGWTLGSSPLSIGTELYNDFNLTNPFNIPLRYLLQCFYTIFGFIKDPNTNILQMSQTGDTIGSIPAVASTYTYNLLNTTGVQSSLVPCNQFFLNGIMLPPGIIVPTIGQKVYAASISGGSTWDNLAWPYLTDQTNIYEVNGSSVVTSQQSCSTTTTTTSTSTSTTTTSTSSTTTTTTTTSTPTTTTTTTAAPIPPGTYSIGQAALGGIIGYILEPGDPGYNPSVQKGLVVYPVTGGGVAWGCQGVSISGADGTAIGTGNQNTIDIVNGCATAGIAARLCSDLVFGGYSDWYLPSKDELSVLYFYKNLIGGFDTSKNYWSSTESSPDTAWAVFFLNGFEGNGNKNDNLIYYRPVRSF